MHRKTTITILTGLFFALTPCLVSQQQQELGQSQPAPVLPEYVSASQQLVVWTRMQKPQPTPQPLPPPDKGIPQPDQQPQQPTNPQTQPSQQQSTQTFTGKIVKAGDKYVLKVSGNTTYQLDGQSGAKQYEDQDVRVIGTLDADSNTIRVVKIELLS